MDLIRWSMSRPVSITVGVLLVVIFGLIGLTRIPIQLTPTVDRPIVTVTTQWPGRSPEEIVDTITKEQEKRLKNVSNLKSMRSESVEGSATITLEFYLGANISRALQEVSDALRQVPQYPDEVDEPVIKAAEGAAQNAIAWIIIDLDPAAAGRHPGYEIARLFDQLDREVKPYIERIDGVAECNVYGGRVKEVHVLVDMAALAQRGLSQADVIRALRAENRNISAGSIPEGKRDYRVRVLGQYVRPEEVLDTIVAYREGRPVYVRDFATVEVGYEKARGFVRSMGVPCLAMNVIRQSGANVMTVMADVRQRLEEVRRDLLPRFDLGGMPAGKDLRMRQVYDETTYISSAIELVLRNLREGGLLSVVVLLVFLRSIRSTLVIALAIPICVIGTFLVMLAAGRTLNVISLAGLAFSTGVVVDNAIVVLENIDRRRGLGDPPLRAVYNGAKEVWGAILAGTLCHIAVFVPILTVREEAGQIFFDLTLALSVSILLSLIVAITVVPAAAGVLSKLDRRGGAGKRDGRAPGRLASVFGLAPLFSEGIGAFSRAIYWLITGWRAWTVRPVVVVVMTLASIYGARLLTPPMDYLPKGNQNLVFGALFVPPGLSQAELQNYAERIEGGIAPYLTQNLPTPDAVKNLSKIFRMEAPTKPFEPVAVENFFVGGFGTLVFCGAISADPQRVLPVGALVTGKMNGMPDAFGGAGQMSIFGQGVGGGDNIRIEIAGPSLQRVLGAATFARDLLMGKQEFGRGSVSATPGNFDLSQPEMRLRLSRSGRELGLKTEDLGGAVRGLFDGAFAGDFLLEGRNVDLKIYPKGGRLETKEQLADVPVMTPSGRVVPLDSVVQLEPARAPQSIQRIEEMAAVTVEVRPPHDRPLQDVMDQIRREVVEEAEKIGLIDSSMRVRLEGSAAKLDEVKAALLGAPAGPAPFALWQRLMMGAAGVVGAAGIGVAVYAIFRWMTRSRGEFFYAATGAILLALIVGGLMAGIAVRPDLVLARMVWTVLVMYLLMCALFESFLYPFIILFTVPLGIVGGFAALAIVHRWTLSNPAISPQQLDVLTMLGFVILIGTVVNNAILLVEQARHFMGELKLPGEEDKQPLPPLRAIAESVRTRVRPIFMTTMTTLGGGIPLVIAPGSGSEMYRGLGAVVVGGLLVSTLFTLVLVPLVFSLVLQMADGLRALFGYSTRHDTGANDEGEWTRNAEAVGTGRLEEFASTTAVRASVPTP